MNGIARRLPQARERREQVERIPALAGHMLASSNPTQCRVRGQRRQGLGYGTGLGYDQRSTLQAKRTNLLVARILVTINWVHGIVEKFRPVHGVGSATSLSTQHIGIE